MTPGLALAIEQVKADDPRPLTITDYPQSFALLSQGYAERDKQQQREAAEPAA